jgi:hypothetical protein
VVTSFTLDVDRRRRAHADAGVLDALDALMTAAHKPTHADNDDGDGDGAASELLRPTGAQAHGTGLLFDTAFRASMIRFVSTTPAPNAADASGIRARKIVSCVCVCVLTLCVYALLQRRSATRSISSSRCAP